MRNSITSLESLESSPSVLPYVISVAGLVTSLMLTSFGYAKESWVVLRRERHQDELQRGIRGHDCYKADLEEYGNMIKCLPWDFADKSVNFPKPFTHVLQPNIMTYAIMYFALLIIALQIFWICYTFAYCCCDPFARKAAQFKNATFPLCIWTAVLWFVTLFLVGLQTINNDIIPNRLFKKEYELRIGTGCWLFVFGGMIPFLIALYGLYDEQLKNSVSKLLRITKKHHRLLPTDQDQHDII